MKLEINYEEFNDGVYATNDKRVFADPLGAVVVKDGATKIVVPTLRTAEQILVIMNERDQYSTEIDALEEEVEELEEELSDAESELEDLRA